MNDYYTREKDAHGWYTAKPSEIRILRHCKVKLRGNFVPAWAAAILDHEETHAGRLDLIEYVVECGQDLMDALDAQAEANPEGVIEMIENYGRVVEPEIYDALEPDPVEDTEA